MDRYECRCTAKALGDTMIGYAVLASVIGALARLDVDSSVKHRWPTLMPWATIGINVSGSAIIGVVAGVVVLHGMPVALQTIVGTGFCGGYTTFSSASYETVRLAQQRRPALALANAVGSLLASVAACGLGFSLTGAL
jgi:fluoride exporter